MKEIDKVRADLRFYEKVLHMTDKAYAKCGDQFLKDQASRVNDTIFGIKLRLEELRIEDQKKRGERRVRRKVKTKAKRR